MTNPQRIFSACTRSPRSSAQASGEEFAPRASRASDRTRVVALLGAIILAVGSSSVACRSQPDPLPVNVTASAVPTHGLGPLPASAPPEHDSPSTPAPPVPAGLAEAIFAGGCFWCMEGPFEALPGVVSVTSGYIGGRSPRPSYNQVSRGGTGHYEAIRVLYDPARVGYARLLEVYVHNIDPTNDEGQFCDEGTQYLSAVFTRDPEKRRLATDALAAAGRTLHEAVVARVLDASVFFVAEDYHQDFYRTHHDHYMNYRLGCGRDARLRELWGDAAAH